MINLSSSFHFAQLIQLLYHILHNFRHHNYELCALIMYSSTFLSYFWDTFVAHFFSILAVVFWGERFVMFYTIISFLWLYTELCYMTLLAFLSFSSRITNFSTPFASLFFLFSQSSFICVFVSVHTIHHYYHKLFHAFLLYILCRSKPSLCTVFVLHIWNVLCTLHPCKITMLCIYLFFFTPCHLPRIFLHCSTLSTRNHLLFTVPVHHLCVFCLPPFSHCVFKIVFMYLLFLLSLISCIFFLLLVFNTENFKQLNPVGMQVHS